jgi:hypothetical protein
MTIILAHYVLTPLVRFGLDFRGVFQARHYRKRRTARRYRVRTIAAPSFSSQEYMRGTALPVVHYAQEESVSLSSRTAL